MEEDNISPLNPVTDLSQVRSKGITQLEKNTFTIKGNNCCKIFPIVLILIGILFIFLGVIISSKVVKVIFIIIGVIFTLISICFSFGYIHTLIITVGTNDLTILQKALLRRKHRVFKKGEISKLSFNLVVRPDDEGVMMNNYSIVISTKDGDEEIYNLSTSWESYTEEEINYFNTFINNHIQNNMS